MSPTVFRYKGYRFFFFSREENRIHIHVSCSEGEAKFWVLPRVEIAKNYGLTKKHLEETRRVVEEHKNEIKEAWKKHFQY